MQTLNNPSNKQQTVSTRKNDPLEVEERNEIIEKYIPLIRKIAGYVIRNHAHRVDYDDLVNVGALGLMQAIKNYNPEYDVNFAGYCKARIRGAMLDELRRLDWVPRQKRRQLKEIEHAKQEFHLRFNRTPDYTELAEEFDIPASTLNACRFSTEPTKMLSLNDLVCHDSTESEFADLLKDDSTQSPDQESEEKDALQECIKGLTKVEQLIVVLYYQEGLNMYQTGLLLGISESRVCQIHSQIMSQLRTKYETHRHFRQAAAVPAMV